MTELYGKYGNVIQKEIEDTIILNLYYAKFFGLTFSKYRIFRTNPSRSSRQFKGNLKNATKCNKRKPLCGNPY